MTSLREKAAVSNRCYCPRTTINRRNRFNKNFTIMISRGITIPSSATIKFLSQPRPTSPPSPATLAHPAAPNVPQSHERNITRSDDAPQVRSVLIIALTHPTQRSLFVSCGVTIGHGERRECPGLPHRTDDSANAPLLLALGFYLSYAAALRAGDRTNDLKSHYHPFPRSDPSTT